MPELRRQLDRLEAGHAVQRDDIRDRMDLAFDRMYCGVPNDEDIDVIPEDLSTFKIPLAIDARYESTASRDAQLSELTSIRLAADVFEADTDEELHQALAALRHLASAGLYRLSTGHRTAPPDEIGMARVVLRFTVRTLERRASKAVQPDNS